MKGIDNLINKEKINNTQIAINHLKVGSQSMIHIDLAVKALEKQMPKKVVNEDYCPICNTDGKDDNNVPGEYCPNCGQKLDWEKLIDLPCKIGDKVKATVCRPYNRHEAYIHGEVVAISEDKKIIRVLYNGCRTIDFYDTDFGKTVFVEEEK
jgi:hypothetical protein